MKIQSIGVQFSKGKSIPKNAQYIDNDLSFRNNKVLAEYVKKVMLGP